MGLETARVRVDAEEAKRVIHAQKKHKLKPDEPKREIGFQHNLGNFGHMSLFDPSEVTEENIDFYTEQMASADTVYVKTRSAPFSSGAPKSDEDDFDPLHLEYILRQKSAEPGQIDNAIYTFLFEDGNAESITFLPAVKDPLVKTKPEKLTKEEIIAMLFKPALNNAAGSLQMLMDALAKAEWITFVYTREQKVHGKSKNLRNLSEPNLS